MQRPPRSPAQGLITPVLLSRLLLVGLGAAALIFWQFSSYRNSGASLELARTVAVNLLVMIEALYLLNCRSLNASVFSLSQRHNLLPSLLAIVGVLLIQTGFTYLPASQQVFGLAPLSASDWLTIVLCAVPIVLVVDLERFIRIKLTTARP